jgi:hypothetical protein
VTGRDAIDERTRTEGERLSHESGYSVRSPARCPRPDNSKPFAFLLVGNSAEWDLWSREQAGLRGLTLFTIRSQIVSRVQARPDNSKPFAFFAVGNSAVRDLRSREQGAAARVDAVYKTKPNRVSRVQTRPDNSKPFAFLPVGNSAERDPGPATRRKRLFHNSKIPQFEDNSGSVCAPCRHAADD